MTRKFLTWLESDYQPVAGGALESNINGIWFAKQTAKGAPVASLSWTKRGRWVGGDIQVNRTDGSEVWSDQTLFSDTVDFVNTLVGNGAPVIQGQSSLTAYLCWLACGQETVTGGVNEVQTIPVSTGTGGTFTISYTILGNVYTTAPIAFNATAAAILTAIQAALPAQYGGTNIVATGGPVNATPVVLTYSGTNTARQPIPLPTVNATGLTGGTLAAPTRTTTGVGYTHVATPADTGGFYFGLAKSVGKSTVHRSQFNDCRCQSLRIEASTASKVLKITPTVVSYDPGQMMSADPTTVDDGLKPFLYTEAAGTFTIDGVVYSGQSSFAVLFTWGLAEFYGDAVTVYDVINNEATARVEGLNLLIDQAGLTRFNNQIYGTPTPAAGSKPLTGLPLIGSYSAFFQRINPITGMVSESLRLELAGMKWEPTLAIPANPAGGAVELSFAGAMRKVAGQPPFRISVVEPMDPAFTV